LDDFFGLIILVLVLFVFIGSFFFVWYPRLHIAINTIYHTNAQLDDEENHLTMYKKNIIKYKDAYTSVSESDTSKIDNMIGPWNQYSTIYHVDLLMTFQELLNNDNFSLISVKTSEAEAKTVKNRKTARASNSSSGEDLPQGIVDVKMELEINDVDYNDLKEILSLLERKLRLVDVSSVNFSPDSETCLIELVTYRFDSEN
jgi:hypothetical protein